MHSGGVYRGRVCGCHCWQWCGCGSGCLVGFIGVKAIQWSSACWIFITKYNACPRNCNKKKKKNKNIFFSLPFLIWSVVLKLLLLFAKLVEDYCPPVRGTFKVTVRLVWTSGMVQSDFGTARRPQCQHNCHYHHLMPDNIPQSYRPIWRLSGFT